MTTRLAAEQSFQDVVQDLGVYISGDRRRLWSKQLDLKQHREGEKWQPRSFLHPKTDLPVLYKIVRSKLEYCCPVCKPNGEIQKLRGEF